MLILAYITALVCIISVLCISQALFEINKLDKKQRVVNILDKKLPPINNEVWTINQGGCGIFADLLSKHLTKLNIDHSIHALFVPNDWNIPYFNEFLNNGKICRSITPNHIVIKIRDTFIDSRGNVNQKVKRTYKDNIQINRQLLATLIANEDGWNECFNRKHAVPLLEKKLQQIFSTI